MQIKSMEKMIYTSILKSATTVPELRSLLLADNLKQITREDFELYQLIMLRRTLLYVEKNSSYYKELFRKHGIDPEEIRSLSDLAQIPLTQPSDLAQHSNRFLCVPLAEIVRPITFISSGTTGPEKRVVFTQSDIERMIDFMEAGMRTIITQDDVVQILLPEGPVLGQLDLLARAVERIGANPVRAGIKLSADEQCNLIQEHGSTMLFGRTGRIYRLTQELLKNGRNLNKLGVDKIFLTSEYLSAALRKRLEELWHCEVYFHYGMSELGLGVGLECNSHDGFHFKEWDLILEVIDPVTKEPVDRGQEGMLVFTTITRQGLPLIRYCTNDISRIIPAKCKCGTIILQKFAHIPYRLEGLIQLAKGDFVYAGLLDEVLFEIPEIIDYQAHLNKKNGVYTLELNVEVVNPSDNMKEDINVKLMEIPVMKKYITSAKMTVPRINLLELNQLKRSGLAKRIVTMKVQ